MFMANLSYNPGLSGQDVKQFEALQKKYANTRFADILSANPYLSYNRSRTNWEALLHQLGFRSSFDKDIEQQANAFREYNAQVTQLASEDQYNSPSEQASRMRQAGLNPDLTGLSGVAGASEFSAEQTSPQYSDGAGDLSALASTCMDVLTMSFGFAKDIQSFKVLQNQVDAGDIDNAGHMIDIALKAASLADTDDSSASSVDIFTDAYKNTFFRSRRNRRSFEQAFNSAAYSLKHKASHYQEKNILSKNKTEDARSRGSKYWSDASDDDIDNAMSAVISPIVQAEENVYSKELKNRDRASDVTAKEIENSEEFVDTIDPSLQARAQNEVNELTSQKNRQDYDLNSVMSKIIHNLSVESNKGNFWASAALLLFSVLRDRVQMPVNMDFGGKTFNKVQLPSQ